jgi:hypothetical protein
MRKQRKLEKEAQLVIRELVSDNPSMSIDDVMNIIRPHYLFDPQLAMEKEIRQLANRTVASVKDEKGIRRAFAYKGRYVNVEKETNIEVISGIRERQEKLYIGTGLSLDKLNMIEIISNSQIRLESFGK